MHIYHKIVSPWKRADANAKIVNTQVFSDDYIAILKDIQWIGTEKVDGENLNFTTTAIMFHILVIPINRSFQMRKKNGLIL